MDQRAVKGVPLTGPTSEAPRESRDEVPDDFKGDRCFPRGPERCRHPPCPLCHLQLHLPETGKKFRV